MLFCCRQQCTQRVCGGGGKAEGERGGREEDGRDGSRDRQADSKKATYSLLSSLLHATPPQGLERQRWRLRDLRGTGGNYKDQNLVKVVRRRGIGL